MEHLTVLAARLAQHRARGNLGGSLVGVDGNVFAGVAEQKIALGGPAAGR